jgi:hypothetical protein
MTTFNLSIDMDNAAFDGDAVTEVQRILRDLITNRLPLFPQRGGGRLGRSVGPLHDINGNTVGTWEVVDDEPDEAEEREIREHLGYELPREETV